MGTLEGKIAVVTGAAKGIGEAIVRRFLKEGIRGIAMFEWNEELCRNVAPIMREKGYGRIVNISSTSAWGNPGQANYAATKAAIQGFTATLAKEMAAKGVTVNAVAPGFIDTDMYAAIPQEKRDELQQKVPMKRLATPDELAAVVNFFSGPDVTFVTGQCLVVSGGSR